ncbi:MAG: hypothetical protein ACN4E2_05025 [Nitrospinota bacterium]
MDIVTRNDWDGVVSTLLLTEALTIDKIKFTHPREIKNGEFKVSSNDILVNLPYVADCNSWFDHYMAGQDKVDGIAGVDGLYEEGYSCARIIYNHYQLKGWDEKYADLIDATDKFNSAMLTLTDILRPSGWLKLATSVDPATGFEPSYEYFNQLIEIIKNKDVQDVLQDDLVQSRMQQYYKDLKNFEKGVRTNSTVEGVVVVTDFRGVQEKLLGNKFLVYALFPTSTVSIRIGYDTDRKFVILSIGKSIINRGCRVNIGKLLLEYQGGGLNNVGSCKVGSDLADEVIAELIFRLNQGC